MATDYLQRKGYEIIARNWRFKHWEIDIICRKEGVLHFVEVKTFKSALSGLPELNVGRKKMKDLISAAEEYIYQHPLNGLLIQYDIIAITLSQPPEILLLEDFFL